MRALYVCRLAVYILPAGGQGFDVQENGNMKPLKAESPPASVVSDNIFMGFPGRRDRSWCNDRDQTRRHNPDRPRRGLPRH